MTLLDSHSAPHAPFRARAAGGGGQGGQGHLSPLEVDGLGTGQGLLTGAARELQVCVHLQGADEIEFS